MSAPPPAVRPACSPASRPARPVVGRSCAAVSLLSARRRSAHAGASVPEVRRPARPARAGRPGRSPR
jgi:hypothetical protein